MKRLLAINSQGSARLLFVREATRARLGVMLLACGALIGSHSLMPQARGQGIPELVITTSVVGEDRKPLRGVTIEGKSTSALACSGVTDAHGQAKLTCGNAKDLSFSASLNGYISAIVPSVSDQGNQAQIDIVLTRAIEVQQTVFVQGESQSPLTESESPSTTLSTQSAVATPLQPRTLVDALPLIPGVIRTPDGRVQIAGMGEEHSALIVNSVEVNDPATGSFGLSVPVDTIETVKVMQSPFLAQYGSFIAGVVSADTRRGGDKWDYSLNDPLPDFRIRSGHLEGLRDASPRLNLSGPLIANRLYMVEGAEYLIDKAEVRTLPFPANETRSNAFNSFSRIDADLGARNGITGTLHFAPHSLRYANLNYFDPQPVTPNADYQEDTGTILEHSVVGGGVLSSIVAGTRDASNTGGQGNLDMVLSPSGNSGSYFGRQSREATRFQWIEIWNPATVQVLGKHDFQAGTVLAHAEDEGYVTGNKVSITGNAGQLLRTISYDGNGVFSLTDFEMASYAQDHWMLSSRLAFDAGIRVETQSITNTVRIAPRGGFVWTPRQDAATIVRGGMGVFYDTVPLDTYAFSNFPQQIVTTFDGSGNTTDGPRRYLNLISTAPKSRFPLIDQEMRSGDFAPYSVAWNLETEHVVSQSLMLRLHYTHSDAQNQLTLLPQINSTLSALVLSDSGALHSRQLEFTSRIGASKQRQFFFSYVRQFARGDLNDASTYLGDFPFPVVRSPVMGRTAGEIPNRFLFWGTSVLPWKMRITPHFEYRNGFTYQPVDELQNYIPFSSYVQPRYPRYFSADLRVAKDVNLGPHHAVRLSVTGRNLTNHLNPLQIHNNVADPRYGTFFGNYGRHFLADFDFLF